MANLILQHKFKYLLEAINNADKSTWNLIETGEWSDDSTDAPNLPKSYKCYDLSDSYSVGVDVVIKFQELQDYCKTINDAEIMLAVLYPQSGFIGWHTNSNNRLHNLICTWSKTGNGKFKKIENGELIETSDSSGWTFKKTLWSKENPVPHAVTTDCDRVTLTFAHKWTTSIEDLYQALNTMV
mgnify:FL=1|jgi:hypothetical protein